MANFFPVNRHVFSTVLICICCLSAIGQSPDTPSYKYHSAHLGIRIPEFREIIEPTTGRNLISEPKRLVIGYAYSWREQHVFSAEGSWSTKGAFGLPNASGVFARYTTAQIPQLRLGYRWMLRPQEYNTIPYLFTSSIFSPFLTPEPGQRIAGSATRFQVAAGLRFFPEGGPVFIQLEIPYTFLSINRISFVEGGGTTFTSWGTKGYENFSVQFWPVVSIGLRW